MARYIDADKADVRTIHSSYMGYSSWADVLEWLQSQPVADVVEVPCRCEKCKYYVAEYCTRDIKGRTNMFYMQPTDFCSYGEERK